MNYPSHENIVYELVKLGELEIDSQGRVWRIQRRMWSRWNKRTVSLPCSRRRAENNPGRYLQVRALIGGKRYHATAHRLVWRHFNGEIPSGITVNHKNGKTHDNRPSNLELATLKEQMAHARDVLKSLWEHKGERCPASKLTEEEAKAIIRRHKAGISVTLLMADYEVSRQTAWNVIKGKNWSHLHE